MPTAVLTAVKKKAKPPPKVKQLIVSQMIAQQLKDGPGFPCACNNYGERK